MTNTNTSDALTVNRTFKSTLFIMLFEDKKNLLELYNAITGKHYADPELLEINTLENAIYMSIKNDVSFLIDGRLSLYEHQSTKNPNLPLRFLLYISHLYSRLTVKENLYGETIVQIPAPEFLIFYNGKDKMPERQILKLSDMYSVQEGQPKLELEATLLNISGSNNQKLKEACRTLGQHFREQQSEAEGSLQDAGRVCHIYGQDSELYGDDGTLGGSGPRNGRMHQGGRVERIPDEAQSGGESDEYI